MATYYSDKANVEGTKTPKGGLNLIADVCTFDIGTALATNDVIKLFKLPKGASVVGITGCGRGVQSGTDAVFTIGDATDPDRFWETSLGNTLSSTQFDHYLFLGRGRYGATEGVFNSYDEATDIEMKITTGGTGMTTGGQIVMAIFYTMLPN